MSCLFYGSMATRVTRVNESRQFTPDLRHWTSEYSDEGQFPMHVFLVFQDGSQSFMKTFVSYLDFCDLQGGLGVPCISVRLLSFKIHISQQKQVGLMFDVVTLRGPFTLGRLALYMLLPKSSHSPANF